MKKNIYKYFGAGTLEKVFANPDQVTLMCSYPKDFNDPYELFLTVDFDQRADIMAFYAEAVGELPQLPTTCFSKSPSVVPMWAHYAQNSKGFVIEFDEKKLSAIFPESNFGDVDYRDAPHDGLTDMLYRASEIGKPRYVYLLQNWVFNSAYYTKTTCWSYEQERRMVVGEKEVREASQLLLLDVPKECVKALISGPQTDAETISRLRDKADELGCNYFQLKIGRSYSSPFLINADGASFIFDGTEIVPSAQYCASCREPLLRSSNFCSWCQIDESHMRAAAQRNPYRIYHELGILDSYIQSMHNVSQGRRKN